MTLELEGLTKVYKDKTALDDVSFSFTPGIYGLLGPNGAGKSTMMNLISDNLTPSKGRVLLWHISEKLPVFTSKLVYAPSVKQHTAF